MFRNTFQSGVISVLSSYGSEPLQLWDIHLEDDGLIRRVLDPSTSNDENCTNDNDEEVSNKVHGPLIELLGSKLSQNYIICPPEPLMAAKKSSLTSTAMPLRPSLGITLPYLILIIQPLEKIQQQPQQQQYQRDYKKQIHFSFEVTILDDKQKIRRFRASTYQSTTNIQPDITTLPLKLERESRTLKRDNLLLPCAKKKRRDSSDYHDSSNYYNTQNIRNGAYCNNNDFDGIDIDHDENNSDENDEDTVPCWNRVIFPLSEYTRRAYGTGYVETTCVQIHANCQLKQVYFSEEILNEDEKLPEEFRLYGRA